MDRGFDERWKRNPKPQATTAGQFEMKTGWTPADLAGKTVLDAGCGIGRFSAIAALWGGNVTGIDAAPAALRGAKQNAPSALFIGHDLMDPIEISPLFDVAFSIGVLHHTADPRASFGNVARAVRSGGELAVWVYAQPVEDALLPAHDFLHAVTRACPPKVLYETCQRFAVPLRDLYARRPDLAYLATVLRASVSPDADECVSDTFDWHTPQYRSYHTAAEVAQWFAEEGFDVIWTGPFPTSMRGRKR